MDHGVGLVKLQWVSTGQRFCSGNGPRVTVQRTFIEVIEECSDEDEVDMTRRSRSAPAGNGGSSRQALPGEGEGETSLHASCAEMRTTVVIRNIPVDHTRDQLVALLVAEGYAGCFDFLYLPVDFAKRTSVGNGFVNFTAPEHAVRFLAHFDGFSRWGASCEAQAQADVGWSGTQGLQIQVERYRNSPIMNASDECKPIVLRGGVRVEFPPPTRKVPTLRRLRTRERRDVPTPEPAEAGAKVASKLLCPLMPGLSAVPGGVNQAATMASPLFAGLTREAACAAASPLLAGLESARGRARPASGHKKAAWADQRDVDECSECSTDAPGSLSGALWSSDGGSAPDQPRRGRRGSAAGERSHDPSSGFEWHSDGGAAMDRRCGSPAHSRRLRSMLAEGLVAVPEDGAMPAAVWPGPIVEVVGAHGHGGRQGELPGLWTAGAPFKAAPSPDDESEESRAHPVDQEPAPAEPAPAAPAHFEGPDPEDAAAGKAARGCRVPRASRRRAVPRPRLEELREQALARPRSCLVNESEIRTARSWGLPVLDV